MRGFLLSCFVHVRVLSPGCSCAFEERILFVREDRSEYEIVQLISMKPKFLIYWAIFGGDDTG